MDKGRGGGGKACKQVREEGVGWCDGWWGDGDVSGGRRDGVSPGGRLSQRIDQSLTGELHEAQTVQDPVHHVRTYEDDDDEDDDDVRIKIFLAVRNRKISPFIHHICKYDCRVSFTARDQMGFRLSECAIWERDLSWFWFSRHARMPDVPL